jgi:hypothetical protein
MTTRLKALLLAIAFGLSVVGAGLARPVADPPVPAPFAVLVHAALPLCPPPLPVPPPPPPSSSVLDGPILALPVPQQRAYWHRMLQQGLRVHDSCLYLIDIGDHSSVPFLIHALRLEPLTPTGSMVCTRRHCLEALQTITHQTLGSTTEAWERWWSQKHPSTKRGPA